MAKRLVPASRRPLAALALLGALCACATTPAEPRATAQRPGWHIVERTGEARHLPPATATWLSAATGEALADGSEVSTGRGSRLIVDAPGRNVSVGPNSRFVLPGGGGDDRLDQRAGSLRYRVAEAAEPLLIHTESLDLELLAGVVDVHVNHRTTEVSVKDGQVRVATPDGLRQTQMLAGQSARADGADEVQLAVRVAPDAELQPVELVIVPAIQPKLAPAAMPTTSVSARAPTAGPPAPPPSDLAPTPLTGRAVQAAPTVPRQAAPEARPGISADAVDATAAADNAGPADGAGSAMTLQSEGELPGAGTPQRPFATHRAADSPAVPFRRAKFDRLTAGMLDRVEATAPSLNHAPDPDQMSGGSR
jgi:ferric-dicitrate binding protein FerR (iron transport regulator)